MLVQVPEGEDIFLFLDRRAKLAFEKSEAWQRNVQPGDFYLMREVSLGLWIYGEIHGPGPEPDYTGMSEEQAAEVEAEASFEKRTYQSCVSRGYHPVRAYSSWCPEGEYGSVHVRSISLLLSKTQFEMARKLAWPNEDMQVRALVGATQHSGDASTTPD